MFGFGVPELLIIGSMVMLVFGVGKLPEIGGAFGKSINNFKKAVAEKEPIELKPGKEDA
jgi:sec-independent protein translocase protein TatA